MKPKTMILMALAITCGLGASYMTSRLLANRGPEEQETVTILVAKGNINMGELLKKPEEMFVTTTVKARDVPEGAVKELEGLKEKRMKRGLRKGDHITHSDMYGANEQLPTPEGHNAVAIRVNLETSVHGFATLPGSRVNVLLTVRSNSPDPNQSYVLVLLEDTMVLAANEKLDRTEGIASQASVVTVALVPGDVQTLTGAKAMGDLSLSLRTPGDTSRTPPEQRKKTFEQIAGKNAPAPQPKVQQAPDVVVAKTPPVDSKAVNKPSEPQPKTYSSTLTIINGPRQTTITTKTNEFGEPLEQGNTQPAPAQPSLKQNDL